MPINRSALLKQHLIAHSVANNPAFPDPMRQQANSALAKSSALLNLSEPAQAPQEKSPDQQEAQAQQQAQVQAQQSAPVL